MDKVKTHLEFAPRNHLVNFSMLRGSVTFTRDLGLSMSGGCMGRGLFEFPSRSSNSDCNADERGFMEFANYAALELVAPCGKNRMATPSPALSSELRHALHRGEASSSGQPRCTVYCGWFGSQPNEGSPAAEAATIIADVRAEKAAVESDSLHPDYEE
jgi:hypothetical protein